MNRKKLFSALFCFLLSVAMMTTTVFAEEGTEESTVNGEVNEPFEEAPPSDTPSPAPTTKQLAIDTHSMNTLPEASNGVITLTDDVELTGAVAFTSSVTLDLAGHTISGTTMLLAIDGDGSTLTIKDSVGNGKISSSRSSNGGVVRAMNKATIVLESGTIEATDGGAPIAVFGAGIDSTTSFTMNGGALLATNYFAITGNGTYHGTQITINEGTITTPDTDKCAIFHPQEGTLTINGGTITGGTGVEMRSGTLLVTGGSITGTADPFVSLPNGSGRTTLGAAIAISQHTTNLPIDVTISGGALSGLYALYETDLQNADTENVTLSVSGGTFTGGTSPVYSQNNSSFISGGTFDGVEDSDIDTFKSYLESKAVAAMLSNDTDKYYVGASLIADAIDAYDGSDTLTLTVAFGDFELQTDTDMRVANTGNGSVVINDVTIHTSTPSQVHVLESVAAKSATCTEAGHIAHYVCTDCGLYFADEEQTTELLSEDLITAATGHNLTHVDSKAATENSSGNIEYWQCSVCGKYFSDSAANAEITKDSTIIAKLSTTSKSTSSPKTGDTHNLTLWTVIMCFAFGCILFSLLIRRKRIASIEK
ncbi:hypothetical protein LJC18_00610 [Lachnospiraceae bacterium OttesenSCG-928-E19]|nr:hypothetical protein [Lachnospiraceae bacterium OttesenSCG-928-E19]